jgi:hypothetical protein
MEHELDVSLLMTRSSRTHRMGYFVVGFQADPKRGETVAFLVTSTTDPAMEVERALVYGCHFAKARSLTEEDAAKEVDEYVKRMAASETTPANTSDFSNLRLKNGTLSYQVTGFTPADKLNQRMGTATHKPNFHEEVSVTPADDVNRALRAGSTLVLVGTNYEPSKDQELEEEFDRHREEQAAKSLAHVKPDLLDASVLSTSKEEYVIVGFKKDTKGSGSVGGYLMPMTGSPREGVETALLVKCHWITVNLLRGRRDLAEQVGEYYENLRMGGKRSKRDPYKLFPISQPPEGIAPPTGDGPTTCSIVGDRIGHDGSVKVAWKKSSSVSPAQDVEEALQAGSTEVVVEVKVWGRRKRDQ